MFETPAVRAVIAQPA